MLGEILQYDFPIVTIRSEDEALPRLIELKEQGYSVVVCDVISSQIAPKLGMNAVLITSGYETVESMLNQAIRLTKRYLHNRQELSHLILPEQSPRLHHSGFPGPKGSLQLRGKRSPPYPSLHCRTPEGISTGRFLSL